MAVRTLALVEFGGVDVPGGLVSSLEQRFGVMVKVSKVPDPWSRKRDWQSNAEDILSEVMATRAREGTDIALGITDDDLFVPGMNFVFGLASREAGAAVVSVNRLKDKDATAFAGRVIKEAVHEVGHLYGLSHCSDPGCVMHLSNTLSDTDSKADTFCPRCSPLLV